MTPEPSNSGRPQPPPPHWHVEPLAGWHLPLLGDPAFLPLQPVLRRALMLALPDRALQALTGRQPGAPVVLVALRQRRPEGLIVTRRLNRSGSCWQVQHLRLATPDQRRPLATLLLRAAIGQARGASSWIAHADTLDDDRLAVLREQGFQPLRTDQLWHWTPAVTPAGSAGVGPGLGELQLLPLNRRTAPLVWQLEQAACPALLRQLLDRRVEDLIDQSRCRGWLLLDPSREQAVAAGRWLGEHPGGGHDIELTLHPGWGHLLGPATELLLAQLHQLLKPTATGLWLRCDVQNRAGQQWLQRLGAEPRGERVLMARSVWHRQDHPVTVQAARRLEAVLGQLQPGRRPLPTPVAPR